MAAKDINQKSKDLGSAYLNMHNFLKGYGDLCAEVKVNLFIHTIFVQSNDESELFTKLSFAVLKTGLFITN